MIYLAAVNLIAFALCGIDKLKAKRDRWRIPEKTLFLSAIVGGSVGFMLGMKLFRHKTKHKSFTIGIPMIFILQVCLAIYLLFIR
ncbi:MAG: DUF1294 domain-containing protein [Clostridia bacterium]|nr:DUF1294 domain-containing protein [Clostridia bacterium]MBQ2326402.1 DUF1294 domain-containing protein [Clostridia bacterium]MBQ5812581.1 DUF1294 domain-containing protein [Clostridia bacterium]